MASGDPELILEDKCGMLVPRLPNHLRFQLGPLLAFPGFWIPLLKQAVSLNSLSFERWRGPPLVFYVIQITRISVDLSDDAIDVNGRIA